MLSARFLIHLGFLLAAVLLTLIITASPALQPYTLQLIAILIIGFFLNRALGKQQFFLSRAIDGLILALVTLLLVYQTNGLSSPVFFLLYILLFGLSLIFDPLVVLIFAIALALIFYGQVKNLSSLIQIIGLLLMTPLALFFGKQYLKVLEEEEKIQILQKKQQQLSQEVTQQEEDTLLWLSLAFQKNINQIIDLTSNMLTDLSRLTISQKENLQKIYQNAKELLQLGKKLREKIEG